MAVIGAQRWRLVLVSSTMERLVMPSFNFGPDSVGMAYWQDLFSMLGFGEGEDREIEKREECQSMGMRFGGRRRLVLHLSGFGKDFFLRLCFFFFFFGFRKVFLFVFMFIYLFFKYCADVENYGSFKSFSFIYRIYRL